MYETQILAARALRDLLDNPDRSDRNELLALVRMLQNAIATGNPVTAPAAKPGNRRRRC
jgi:hypothetical protein